MIKLLLFVAGVIGLVLASIVLAYLMFPAASAPGASGSPSASAAGEPIGAIEITAFDLGFEPATVDIPTAGVYTLTFANTGAIAHDITLDGGAALTAQAGETASAEVTVPEGGIGFICSIPGHADGGMRGVITVAGAGPDDGDHGGPAPATTVEKDPNAPAYQPRDATAPPLLEGEVHDIDLVIEEKEMTVAEGYVQKVWTFNGSVPGPVIRVQVGDTIRIHLQNPAKRAATLR